jgi:4-diphosphocytidyl-2-C-methyl-D-erythritol kinase
MPTAVRSHAKINLGLYIGAPRPDGFHGLVTVYQTLELHDIVTVSADFSDQTSIRITSNDERVPTDNRNTACKMVDLALRELRLTAEVEIHIEKRLPVQGGLGAGSGNAVATLVGLEKELGLESLWPQFKMGDFGFVSLLEVPEDIQFEELRRKAKETSVFPKKSRIAAQVGSDVPLFLVGGAALGIERGEVVFPLPDFEPVWCAVAIPAVGVSTPQAFRDWDALCAEEGLTHEASHDKLKELSRAYASAFARGIAGDQQRAGSSGVLPQGENLAGPQESALVRTGILDWIENDFERVVFPQHPSLAEIKRILAASGTPEASLHASLSGSGSALFGLYKTRGDAEAACERLRQAGVESHLTRTLPRAEYWREMLLPERV